MARMIRPDWHGAFHHVMARGIDGREVFAGQSDKIDLTDRLGRLVPEMDVDVFAWAVMPNHLHLLIRTGIRPVCEFMHRLLTGFAVVYNKRNDRKGHVFQGRFKSIPVQEDIYFLRLLGYIHCNPIKAGIVSGFDDLEEYRWCGHGAILGARSEPWQNVLYVLSKLGSEKPEQVKRYQEIIIAEISDNKSYEYLSGTFVLGSDGIKPVSRNDSLLARGNVVVLGSRYFATEVYNRIRMSGSPCLRDRCDSHRRLEELLERIRNVYGFSRLMLRGKSRSPALSDARAVVAWVASSRLGFSRTDCMHLLGMSRNGVRKAISRGAEIADDSQFIKENEFA